MSLPKFLLPSLAIIALLAFAPAFAQAPPAPSEPDLKSAGELGSQIFQESGSTGLVLVVVRNHQVFFRGYGETAPNSHQLPNEKSLIRLCSLTKIFTTDVLTKLVADKTVSLNDPLQQFAPPHIQVPMLQKPITLLNLATHTSGLPREIGTGPRRSPHFTYPDFSTRWNWLPTQTPISIPGTSAVYSNVAFDFLSDALQSAAHKQYAALLAQRTLAPLHMQSTTYFPNADQCSRLLLSNHNEGLCSVTEATAGSSGLYSTPADMALWLQYLLADGSPGGPPGIPLQDPAAQAIYLLPSDLVSQQGLSHAGKPSAIGLGWMHLLSPDTPSHIVEKTGGGAGFTTYIAINHAHRTAVFVAATDGSGDSHVNLFDAANNLLLAMSGLPLLPAPPPRIHARSRHRATPVPRHRATPVPHRRRRPTTSRS
jgi:D-alanyl-D-alanine-carboxypeptidase/D-alanyl-D-alanine-endopeptidase